MIVPTRLEIENFALIKKADVPFPKPSFYYVAGNYLDSSLEGVSNGSGKTTFLNAMWYALTGNLIQRINFPDIIGPHGKSARTVLHFASPKHTYRIERTRLKSKGLLDFYLDEELANATTNDTNTEKKIAEAFGLDWELIRYTNYLPQEELHTSFIYTRPGERRDLVTKLYDKRIFDKVLGRLKINVKAARENYDKHRKAIDILEGKIEVSEKHMTGVKRKITVAEKKNKEITVEAVTDRNKRVKDFNAKIAKCMDTIKQYEGEVEKVEKQQEDLGLEDLEKKLQRRKDKLSNINSDMANTWAELAELKEPLKSSKECPTCLEPLSKKSINVIKKKCNEKIKWYKTWEAEREAIIVQKNKIRIESDAANLQDGNLRLSVCQFNEKIRDHQRRLSKLEAGLDGVGKTPELTDLRPLQEMRTEGTAELKKLYGDCTVAQKEAERLRLLVEALEFWEDGYTNEIRAMAFEGVVEQFAQRVTEQLSPIYEDNIAISFDTKSVKNDKVTDKFTVLVRDGDSEVWKDVMFASGGQKRILSLSLALAMQMLNRSKLGMMLLDESLENMDPTAMNNSINVLKGLGRESVVLFVTHDIGIVPEGESIIRAARKGGEVTFD